MLVAEAAGILNVAHRTMRRLCLEKKVRTRKPNRRERAEGVPPNAYVIDGDSVRKLARARKGR